MFHTPALRRLAPVALLAASALVLSSCGSTSKDKSSAGTSPSASSSTSPSSSPSTPVDANGCHTYAAGKTSDTVKVSGAFGQAQDDTFTEPLTASSLERTVVSKGTGKATAPGQKIDTLISIYLGKDGKKLGSQKVTLTEGDSSMIEAFGAGIDCVPIGSRVVVTAPAKDMYGAQGNTQLGITAADTLVITTDVLGVQKPLVPGVWKTNAPKVTFDAKGKPTLTLPGKKPEKKLLLKVLRPGKGAAVKSGDSVTVDYQGTSWNTGKIFDQSYGKQPATFKTTEVVPGFGAALVGQKVGSRIVVTIPPADAYGATKSQAAPLGGQTLVFVIEIKSTTAGQ